MAEIIPAIIARDFKDLETKLGVLDGLTRWRQLDVTDGLFASPTSFQEPDLLEELDGQGKIEVHLMIERPEYYLPKWLRVADRVIVHFEATEKLDEVLRYFTELPIESGLAVLLHTPLQKILPWVPHFKLIQLMGIAQIGAQGQPFDKKVIERVKFLRARFPDVTIAVDGGISLPNAKELLAAGVNNLVVGSAIWQAKDPVAALKKFQALLK